ncbi:MAG: phage head closure protein [Anaerolineae bacterium]
MNIGGKATNPGELRTAITLQQRTVTRDAGGFTAPEALASVTVWARWINVHGAEAWTAAFAGVLEPATVLIRYVEGLDATWSVVKGEKTYKIVSVDDISERHEYLELKVKRVAEG